MQSAAAAAAAAAADLQAKLTIQPVTASWQGYNVLLAVWSLLFTLYKSATLLVCRCQGRCPAYMLPPWTQGTQRPRQNLVLCLHLIQLDSFLAQAL